MNVATYLKDEKGRLGRQSKRIKDFSVFDFDYIPEEPLMREECKELIDEMLQFELSGIPTHFCVVGHRGSGKTLMLKYLQRIMPGHTKLAVLYANCRQHNTSFKILAHLLGVQARGASLGELLERFQARCEQKTVVVLDEVDMMSPKDKQREILYFLSRSSKPFMVIMLTNTHHVLKELDAATRSSLQPVPIYFKNYNAEQIAGILTDRAKKGLSEWNEGQLAQIAALTTRRANADARVAIKTLHYSVIRPQDPLEACFEKARKDTVIDMILDLSDPVLLILWSAASSRSHFAKDIYTRYCRLSQIHHEKPFSYVHFYSNLSYLQSAGLVALIATKVGRTYTNRVMLTFEEEILRQICELRFER
jgi:cell division control protein 6